jgi:outer membrane protein assembly factor BamA
LDAALRAFASTPALGADLSFLRATLSLRYEHEVARARGAKLVARVLAGAGTDGLPLDEGFGLGGGPESPFPLRAHRQFDDGVAGGAPLGRSLLLFNTEWRQPLLAVGPIRLGAAAFYDAGRAFRGSVDGRWLHDTGVGLRLGLHATVVRIDFAHGWVDGANAVTLGVGQAF